MRHVVVPSHCCSDNAAASHADQLERSESFRQESRSEQRPSWGEAASEQWRLSSSLGAGATSSKPGCEHPTQAAREGGCTPFSRSCCRQGLRGTCVYCDAADRLGKAVRLLNTGQNTAPQSRWKGRRLARLLFVFSLPTRPQSSRRQPAGVGPPLSALSGGARLDAYSQPSRNGRRFRCPAQVCK